MRSAILTDIHAARDALEAVLADLAPQNIDQMVLLGDYVGFGPDVDWVLTRVEQLAAQGALALRGNHDRTVPTPKGSLNIHARRVVDWTVNQLTARQRLFLDDLPLVLHMDEAQFTHASPYEPHDWHYITDSASAALAFGASPARLMFCGHSHVPSLHRMDKSGQISAQPISYGTPIYLEPSARWLAVVGAVGVGADAGPNSAKTWANYCVFDSDLSQITYMRTPYDAAQTAARARAAHMPRVLMRRP